MAGFLELIDNALGTHFDAPVYDPQRGRRKMLKVINDAAKQHREGITKAPNRAWRLGSNNAISFSPKLNGQPVLIGSAETNYVSAERFQDFLAGLRTAVEAGDLDVPIKMALEVEDTNKLGIARSATRGERKLSPQGTVNIRVGGMRRGNKADPDIRKLLESEGVSGAMIDAALARKKG